MTKGKKAKKPNVPLNIASTSDKVEKHNENHSHDDKAKLDGNSKTPVASEISATIPTVNTVSNNFEMDLESNAKFNSKEVCEIIHGDTQEKLKTSPNDKDVNEKTAGHVSKGKEGCVTEEKVQMNKTKLESTKLKIEETKKNTESKIQTAYDQKTEVTNKQNVKEQTPAGVTIEQDSVDQNLNNQKLKEKTSQESVLKNKPQEEVTILNSSQCGTEPLSSAVVTELESVREKKKDTVESEQEIGESILDVTDGDQQQQKNENRGVDQTKKEETIKEQKETNEQEKINISEKVVANKIKAEEDDADRKTIDSKVKDSKCNENHKKKNETEQKCKSGSKNDHKKKQDSTLGKPPQYDACCQRSTNRIAGIEIREHVNGNVVTEIFDDSQNSNERFKIICHKYSELYNDFKILHVLAKKQEKQIELLQNEKEILEVESAKQNSSREKLEHLCRELQKQNKAIREDNLQIIREEEEKRKSVSKKFEKTFQEISNKVQESNSKTNKLRDDNLDITVKFRDLLIECDKKDQELYEYREKCAGMLKTEENLRNQISMYTEKYDGFQHTLSRSNEIFAGFKSEMEVMSTKINNLESETATWKQRWENSHQAYLDVFNQKTNAETQLLSASRQLAALLKLCRTLQKERGDMLSKLNGTDASTKKGVEDTNQETIEDTLRQIVQNVSDSLKNSSSDYVNAGTSAGGRDVSKEQTLVQNKASLSAAESLKMPNKISNKKK